MQRRFVIRGRVQGVFFRASTREQAEALGLTGWVRNAVDGSVHCVACGEAVAIDALQRWFDAGGPPAARVDAIDAVDEPDDSFNGFVVLR